MRYIALLPILLLTGCATAEQQMAADDAKCQSYGTPKGSQAYVDCRLMQEAVNQRRREDATASPAGAIGALLNR